MTEETKSASGAAEKAAAEPGGDVSSTDPAEKVSVPDQAGALTGKADGKVKKVIREYAMVVFGAFLVSLGVYFFKFPNNFSTGGVSGISVILGNYFKVSSASNVSAVINAVMLIIGFAFMGRDCGAKTVVGSFTLSGMLMIFEKLIPLDAPMTDQPLLELVYAIMLPAVGSAILFSCEGSTGGTDIIAMILRKYTRMNIGTGLLCSDIGITLLTFLFGVKTGLFSLLGLVLKTFVVDSVIDSINQCKCFQIITDSPDAIAEFITKELGRSCTIIEGVGGYTHRHKYMVTAAMRRYQASRLQRYLKKSHPETFMMITNSSEVIGKGFRGL